MPNDRHRSREQVCMCGGGVRKSQCLLSLELFVGNCRFPSSEPVSSVNSATPPHTTTVATVLSLWPLCFPKQGCSDSLPSSLAPMPAGPWCPPYCDHSRLTVTFPRLGHLMANKCSLRLVRVKSRAVNFSLASSTSEL